MLPVAAAAARRRPMLPAGVGAGGGDRRRLRRAADSVLVPPHDAHWRYAASAPDVDTCRLDKPKAVQPPSTAAQRCKAACSRARVIGHYKTLQA